MSLVLSSPSKAKLSRLLICYLEMGYDQMQNLQIKRQIVLTEQISKKYNFKRNVVFLFFFPRKSQQIVLKNRNGKNRWPLVRLFDNNASFY